jgi:outer membrane receptor protein involved in Fe transport
LNDPTNGDEINQRETRNIYGYTATSSKHYIIGSKNANTQLGAGLRYDDVNNIELNHVVKRSFIEHVQQGDLHEMNAFAWVDQQLELSSKFNINAGLRYDFFQFGYKDILAGETGFKKQTRGTLSPKLNFNYIPNLTVKVFLNTGIGFHSNDTRVILDKQANDILPKVFGADLGVVLKPTKNLLIKTALWQLYSQQEFVYVGDAGIVEPSGKTRRAGIDASVRYQVLDWLYADIDLNYARPRAINEPKGENYVPLAPTFTSIGGLTVKTKHGFNGSLRYRYIGDRPANEDNSVIAEGYLLLDAVISYNWKRFEFSASMENILNRKWKEAQFDTESRLFSEPAPVSEIHYTPGTPRFFKAGLAYNF